ncbi:Uncharacterised protein [Mycobacterium tuberculosis]|nr:Uncharacterised protein [Mycobacterium tuberculosis]
MARIARDNRLPMAWSLAARMKCSGASLPKVSASSCLASNSRAFGRKTCPSSVSRRWRGVRSTKRLPSRFSSSFSF